MDISIAFVVQHCLVNIHVPCKVLVSFVDALGVDIPTKYPLTCISNIRDNCHCDDDLVRANYDIVFCAYVHPEDHCAIAGNDHRPADAYHDYDYVSRSASILVGSFVASTRDQMNTAVDLVADPRVQIDEEIPEVPFVDCDQSIVHMMHVQDVRVRYVHVH